MGLVVLLGVVFPLAFGIFTRVVLPSADVVADVLLMADTYNFVGDDLEIVGCRACFGKSEMDIHNSHFLSRQKSEICVSDRDGEGHSGIYCAAFPGSLSFMTNLQNSKNFQHGDWHMGSNFTLENGTCEKNDLCCIKSSRKFSTFQRGIEEFSSRTLNNTDRRISWAYCRNKRNCDADKFKHCENLGICEECLGIGQSKTAPECEKLYRNTSRKSDLFQNNNCERNVPGMYHLKHKPGERGNEYVEGPCNFEDGCCMDIKETKHPSNYWRCSVDVCLQHLNWIQTDSKIIKNLSSWYTGKDIIHGRSVGGKVCKQLRFYASCMIGPLLLSFAFTMVRWRKDYMSGDTHGATMILAVLQFYSQWRALRSLFSTKDRMKKHIDERNFTLELIEPLLESVLQVHISYAIIMTRESFFPTDPIGHHVADFETFSDVLPVLSFILSLLGSSLGMTKFIIFGPFADSSISSASTKDTIINVTCIMLMNLMFSLRMFSIEAIFFSYYQSYKSDFTIHERFQPIVKEDELRILFYLLPPLIPMIVNNIRLAKTYRGCTKLYLNFPHLLLIPGFTPFMYEGTEDVDNKGAKATRLRIWKQGTFVNAVYLCFIAPMLLLTAEFIRGTVSWDPTTSKDVPFKYTNNMIKAKYDNGVFSITALALSLVSILFLNARLFKLPKSENMHGNAKTDLGHQGKSTINNISSIRTKP